MKYDYSKLKGKIIEVCTTQKKFASLMHISERTVSLKLNNKRSFTQPEIDRAIKILKLPSDQIDEYFFNKEVQFIELNA